MSWVVLKFIKKYGNLIHGLRRSVLRAFPAGKMAGETAGSVSSPTTSSVTPARGNTRKVVAAYPGESGGNTYDRGKEHMINLQKRSEQGGKIAKLRTLFLRFLTDPV